MGGVSVAQLRRNREKKQTHMAVEQGLLWSPLVSSLNPQESFAPNKKCGHEMEATCDMGGVVPFGRAIHAAPVGIEVFFVCFPFVFFH